eukprot:jgi/Picre1/29691/NNA_005074.t1
MKEAGEENSSNDGKAVFPDTTSTRAQRHVQELMDTDAQAAMIYVVQRDDCSVFAPCFDKDPVYAERGRIEEGDILIDGIYEHNNSETAEVVRINHQQNETEPMVYLSCALDDQAVQYTRVEGPVRFDTFRVSKNVSIDQENGVLESYAGYRSVRATHGAFEGTWMFEVKVEDVEPGWWECGLVGRPNLAHWMSLWDHMWMGMDTVCTLRRLFISKKDSYGNEVKAGDVIGCFCIYRLVEGRLSLRHLILCDIRGVFIHA